MSLSPLKTMTNARSILASFSMAFIWVVIQIPFVLAQANTVVTSTTGDGSLGTIVTTHNHTAQITGGTRPGNGTNLFHSFAQFSVGVGDTARFLNTTPSIPTSNILNRVTGGNPSSIFGTIDTMSYPGANLFLMNPAGIVFGPHTTLNVSGSVAFTTADYLRLAGANGSNTGIFHADAAATSLLTSASIAAFGFLGSNPAAIAIQGSTLKVQPGHSISLVGGNQDFALETGISASVPGGITVTSGKLLAQNGQVNIASVASPGEIHVGTLGLAPNINGRSFGPLGTVQISHQSHIDTSGEGGGTILIRGGRLVVDASTISANTKPTTADPDHKIVSSGAGIDIQVIQDAVIDNGAVVETNVESGASHGSGGVRITADHLTIAGGLKAFAFVEAHPDDEIPFGISSKLGQGSTAVKSGDISLSASSSIQIKDLGQIKTATKSNGSAGHITLNSAGNIVLDSSDLFSRVEEGSKGKSGNITLDSQHGDIRLISSNVFTITDGTTGTLGTILVNARDLNLHNGSKIGGDNTSTQMPGDTIIILSGQLSLVGGSFINTGAFGSGKSADLIIQSPTILIAGTDKSGKHHSGLYTSTISSGDGGRLRLSTDQLQLTDGGILSSQSFIGFQGEVPSGSGGIISIQGLRTPGPSISIEGPGSGIFTNTEGIGAAGAINLIAQSLTMSNGATITASNTGTPHPDHGPGPANIFINAGHTLEMRDSKITTESKQTSGGNIDIRAIDRIRLINSSISTSVPNGTGNGGNITIDPKVMVLQHSDVLAVAARGQGGNITITTPTWVQDQTSRVDASSQFGMNGTVTIQSPTSNLSGTVGQLVSKTSPPQVLLQNRCMVLAGGEQSTFLLSGRETLPHEPGGWLSSPVSVEHWTEENTEHAAGLVVQNRGLNTAPTVAAQKNTPAILSLRRLTPPGFLVRTFATGATGCPS